MSFNPQLADTISTDKLPEYLTNPDWWFEQKLDGIRMAASIEGLNVQVWGRNGTLVTKPEASLVRAAFKKFPGTWTFDGEFVDGEFWIFDMPYGMDVVTPNMPYSKRREALEKFVPILEERPKVRVLPTYRTADEKFKIAEACIADHCEGLIVKRHDAPYHEGKRSPNMLKAKFWESVDVIVIEVAREGKRSVAIAVYSDGNLIDVGSCTVTDRMLRVLEEGDVIEVKYLYAADPDKPRIYQPSFLRIRDDKAPEECTIDQIKYTSKRVLTP